jgi:Tfp pilus assembly protein PilX
VKKHNQKGFSAVVFIVVVLVVCLLAGAVWYVANNKKDDKAKTQQQTTQAATSDTPADTDDPTAEWYEYTLAAGAGTIKLPDGLTFYDFLPDGSAIHAEGAALTMQQGTPAKVINARQAGASMSGDSSLSIIVKTTGEYKADENYQTMCLGGSSSKFTTNSGSVGSKKIDISSSSQNIKEGTKIYRYCFRGADKQVYISYNLYLGQTDKLAIVEQMVKTIELN